MKWKATSHIRYMKEKDFKIHFFITAGYIEDESELVQRMVDEGHIVCNHSVWHKNGPKCLEEEELPVTSKKLMANETFRNLTGEDLLHSLDLGRWL